MSIVLNVHPGVQGCTEKTFFFFSVRSFKGPDLVTLNATDT